MQKYSISSNFASLDFSEAMAIMGKHGFRYAELAFEHSQEFLQLGDPEKIGVEKSKYAREQGICILQGHLLFPGVDLADADPVRRQKYVDDWKKELVLFEAIGIRNAVLHPGGFTALAGGMPLEQVAENRTDSLRQLAEFTRNMNVRVCLENLSYGRYMSVAEDLVDAIERTGMDNLGIILDTGHLNINGWLKQSQRDFILKAGKYLHALHLQDNHGKSDEHLFPLQGTIDFREVASALKEIGYDDLYNLEIPGESWVVNSKYPELMEYKVEYARHVLETIFPD